MSARLHVRPLLLLCSLVVCVLFATRCGETQPDPILSGIYVAQVPPGHFDILKLQLENHGGEISGTACYESSGYLLITGVPVHGSGSSISFTADQSNATPCAFNPAGTTLVARQGSDGMFKGTFHINLHGSDQHDVDVRDEAITLLPTDAMCTTTPPNCVN